MRPGRNNLPPSLSPSATLLALPCAASPSPARRSSGAARVPGGLLIVEVRSGGSEDAGGRPAVWRIPVVEVGATLQGESEWDIKEVAWSAASTAPAVGAAAGAGWELVADGGSGGVRVWQARATPAPPRA